MSICQNDLLLSVLFDTIFVSSKKMLWGGVSVQYTQKQNKAIINFPYFFFGYWKKILASDSYFSVFCFMKNVESGAEVEPGKFGRFFPETANFELKFCFEGLKFYKIV